MLFLDIFHLLLQTHCLRHVLRCYHLVLIVFLLSDFVKHKFAIFLWSTSTVTTKSVNSPAATVLVPYCREAAIKNKNFGLWAAEAAHVSNLLPLRGNKKEEFGLWAAEAAHVGRPWRSRMPHKNQYKISIDIRPQAFVVESRQLSKAVYLITHMIVALIGG
jgi:hypothetical protein